MNMKSPMLYDSRGNQVVPSQKLRNDVPRKQATGLYGNIYQFPNYGKFRPRYYSLGDTNQGLDTLSRELLVRWSREMYAQQPFIPAAINALAEFSIGNSYLPEYYGTNKEWWKLAEEWLLESWYPNCSTKGSDFDFQTLLNIESKLIDVDGDYLIVFGEENGFPKFQIIQNNRIKSQAADNTLVTSGPYAGLMLSDGIYYTLQGKPVAYNIYNANNLVNQMATITEDKVFTTREARLIYDARYVDKARGIPSIGSAILQALSIQELDSYLMEKIKIESTIALIEKTPSGEAPLELQNTLEALNQQGTEYGAFNPSPNTHAIDIVQGSQIRYVHAEGGDIKTLASNSPGNETAEYMVRLETQILSTLGVPHQLIYSTDKIGGRITTGVAEIFRSAISRRQKIMDKRAKFTIAWALAKAMDSGFIPRNDEESLFKVINFTHPKNFTLDAKYDNQIIVDQYDAGFSTLNSATTKLFNKTAEQTLSEQAQEQIMFYQKAQEVASATGMDINVVMSNWRKTTVPQDFVTKSNTDESEQT